MSRRRVSLLAPLLLAAPGAALAQSAPAFDAETVRAVATLPVQEGGRVKPLHTLAAFRLLKLSGRRTVYTPEPAKRALDPAEWLLHCLVYPDAARTYPVFLVQNDEVLDAVGLEHEGRGKRDRYSYDELAPARQEIFRQAKRIETAVPAAERTPVEEQLAFLNVNLFEFELLIHYLDFAREPLLGDARLRFSQVLGKAGPIAAAIAHYQRTGALPADLPAGLEPQALAQLVQELRHLGRVGSGLALFPPLEDDAEAAPEWRTPQAIVDLALSGQDVRRYAELLGRLEAAVTARDDPTAVAEHLAAFHAGMVTLARERGEYGRIPLEVSYYRVDPLYKALLSYVLAFAVVALSWLWPRNRWLYRGTNALLVVGTALLVGAIVVRCVIRGRPPVSTLYETILFITASAALVSLAIEWVNRARIAQGLAAVLGAGGLFLAYKYEVHEGTDTMPALVAVLDTNFWLATHVTTVTLGYAAGLLAGAMGHVYLAGWTVNAVRSLVSGQAPRPDGAFYRNLSRMTYGVLCFGLFFAIIGTVLGGIWANYSWGRFWGWDPKENGALMICLWQLAILHARLGGYLKHFGLALAAAAGTVVVAFSWWGVNLLGVGLHSYGFTSGVKRVLLGYYWTEAVFLLGVALLWLVLQVRARRASPLVDPS